MFFNYVTRPGSNIKVGFHATGPASDPDRYIKYKDKAWIIGNDLLTNVAIRFLSKEERNVIADKSRREAEAVASGRILPDM